ncbi:MAG: glutathione S-transferase N-terminal domain-containing protein [Magnetospirillum sp.]|nr:glutathione S-transferase N-terminal domain-containing protein [Magnetospirillum sp.]
MILYATELSSYSLKVRLAAALKGVVLDLRAPPEGYRSAAYRALVPSGTVPALVDGDFTLAESDTILEYLEDRFPHPALLPDDPRGRAQARFLGRLHDLRLEPKLRACFPGVATGTVPAGTETAIAADLALIDGALDPEGPFAVGPVPSLADCAYPASFAILEALAPVFGWRLEPAARTARWRAAFAAHPVFEDLLTPYRAALAAWVASKR